MGVRIVHGAIPDLAQRFAHVRNSMADGFAVFIHVRHDICIVKFNGFTGRAEAS